MGRERRAELTKGNIMKYIQCPDPIRVGNATQGLLFSFDDFVRYIVNADVRFNAGGPGIRAGLKVETALEKARGEVVELANDVWELLRQAAESPTGLRGEPIGYPALVDVDGNVRLRLGREVLPFLDAIGGATDDPPVAEMPAEPVEAPAN